MEELLIVNVMLMLGINGRASHCGHYVEIRNKWKSFSLCTLC